MAADFGHLTVVQHFCNILSDKSPKDSCNITPLHLAAQEGHTKVVKYLVQHVEDIHPRDNSLEQSTPFDDAKQQGHAAIVNILRPCQTAQKSVKKARRKEEETEIQNILQQLGIDDEKEKAKKTKKKAKKPKKTQSQEVLNTEPPSVGGAAALVEYVAPVQEDVEEEEGDECTICFGLLQQTYMLYPCGHATFCKDCAYRLFKSPDNRCPDCRTLIKDTVRVFGTVRP